MVRSRRERKEAGQPSRCSRLHQNCIHLTTGVFWWRGEAYFQTLQVPALKPYTGCCPVAHRQFCSLCSSLSFYAGAPLHYRYNVTMADVLQYRRNQRSDSTRRRAAMARTRVEESTVAAPVPPSAMHLPDVRDSATAALSDSAWSSQSASCSYHGDCCAMPRQFTHNGTVYYSVPHTNSQRSDSTSHGDQDTSSVPRNSHEMPPSAMQFEEVTDSEGQSARPTQCPCYCYSCHDDCSTVPHQFTHNGTVYYCTPHGNTQRSDSARHGDQEARNSQDEPPVTAMLQDLPSPSLHLQEVTDSVTSESNDSQSAAQTTTSSASSEWDVTDNGSSDTDGAEVETPAINSSCNGTISCETVFKSLPGAESCVRKQKVWDEVILHIHPDEVTSSLSPAAEAAWQAATANSL